MNAGQRREKRRLYRFYGILLAVLLLALGPLYIWVLRPYTDMAGAQPVQMSGELYVEGGYGPVFDQIYFLEGPFAVVGDEDGETVQKEYYFYYPSNRNEEGKFAIVELSSSMDTDRLEDVLAQSLLTDDEIAALDRVAYLSVKGKIEPASEELLAYAKNWVSEYWQSELNSMAFEDLLYQNVLSEFDYPTSGRALTVTFWTGAGLLFLLWLAAFLKYAVLLRFPEGAEDVEEAYAKQTHPCKLSVGIRMLYVRGLGRFRMVALSELHDATYENGVLLLTGEGGSARFHGLEEDAANELVQRLKKVMR